MRGYSGEFIASLLLALALSWVAALVVSRRYRSTLRRLMAAPPHAYPVDERPAASPMLPSMPAASGAGIAANRRAGRRLTLLLAGLSCLIAITGTWIWLHLAVQDVPRTPKQIISMSLYNLWPAIPAVGLVWRWSLGRLLTVWLVWGALAFVVLQGGAAESRALPIARAFVVDVIPSLLITLVFYSGATRAVAPWLFLPLVGLAASALAGMRVLADAAAAEAGWLKTLIAPLEALPSTVAVALVLAAFALLPPMLAWWPLRRFGRALGRAYARQQLSELLAVFCAVWAVLLLGFVATTMDTAGPRAALLMTPLLWVPAVMWPYARWVARPASRPPTLLVLRVFQRDRAMLRLFDGIVERWRLSGNTILIAGTDLVDRTIDADDVFTFLDGRLASRLIATRDDIPKRIEAFVLAPDAEGRYRVNECYCHDSTWQPTLQALVGFTDVALMDLRGFQLQNAGCRFELATLAHAARDLRAVVLTDATTDEEAIRQTIAGGRTDRFVSLRVDRLDRSNLDLVLGRLLDEA